MKNYKIEFQDKDLKEVVTSTDVRSGSYEGGFAPKLERTHTVPEQLKTEV